MSTRELVFSYQTKGARAAAKADSKVRQSVRRTGRVASRNGGQVERWMSRNREAITAVSTAAAAGIAGILSLSPTLRAQLGGVRAGFTLFADTIVRDLLPAGASLGKWIVKAAQWYRDLEPTIRKPISALIAFAGVVAGVIAAAAAFAGTISAVASALAPVVGALVTAAKFVAGLISAFLGIVTIKAVIIAAIIGIAVALIFNIGGARDKTIQFLVDIWEGFKNLLGRAWDRTKTIAAGIRDALVGKIRDMKERVVKLLELGREFAQAGKDWIGGLVEGVRSRASELVKAFKNMASDVARGFKKKFNDIIPSEIGIDSVSISVPDALGGGSVSTPSADIDIPRLNTGGRIVGDGLAMLHAGERIMPAAQVRDRGRQNVGGGTTVENVTIMVQGTGDPRQDGRNIAQEFERQLGDRGA